jgi:hypothetical protein
MPNNIIIINPKSIKDNYTFAQPGIQKMVFQLQALISTFDRSFL